jgi:enamine deaminase RidA (YjgF/YER057c/UK114 family)
MFPTHSADNLTHVLAGLPRKPERTQPSNEDKMSDIKRIDTGTRMSQAVIHNGTVYLAGQVGEPGTSVTDQTTTILAKHRGTAGRGGSDKTKILQAVIWLADMADFAEMNAVWDAWVAPGHAPARACGEAKLATPDYTVEIIIVAAQ